jgi:5-methylcytosine-specific restriction protein A
MPTKINTITPRISRIDTRVGSSAAVDRIRGWRLTKIRERILLRDGYRCRVCGWASATELVVDHVIPLFAGGNNSDPNLQSLCKDCHKLKSDKEEGGRE